MNRVFAIGLLMFAVSAPASAIKVPRGIKSCPTLDACLTLLDTVVPAEDNGEGGNSEIFAKSLQRFGDPAKQELFERVNGPHRGWRNLASAILGEWKSWSSSDVPALRAALKKCPGGWLARPLGRIGTPEAIQALVDTLPENSGNQNEFALKSQGAKAVPYLLPVFENEKKVDAASVVIRQIGEAAVPFASGWVSIAVDTKQSRLKRIAALRGIAAIGDRAAPVCSPLHQLLSGSDSALQKQAHDTLRAVHDPIMAEEALRACRPTAGRFDHFVPSAYQCLWEADGYKDKARPFGDRLLPLLTSENAIEQVAGITALSMVGYDAAIPKIEQALTSRDWRVVSSAVRSLGSLGAKQSIPALKQVSTTHWLPEVRKEAKDVIAALQSLKGRLPISAKASSPDFPDFDSVPPCSTGRWVWNGTEFRMPTSQSMHLKTQRTSLKIWGGELTGSNAGEFGGELAWKPAVGKQQVLLKDNVVALFQDGDSAIALLGLGHGTISRGYAIQISRDPDGNPQLTEIARLPGAAYVVTAIGQRVYATSSEGRVVVFSRQGILGLATCSN